MARHEFQIAGAGGLDSRLLAFLLAVQATVRDDVLPALDALRPTQAADVAAWREVLDDHEDELVARLGLDRADDALPPRPDAPRAATLVARHAEADLTTFNLGKRVYRVPGHRGFPLMFGGLVGVPGLAAIATAVGGAGAAVIACSAIAGVVVGPIVGYRAGKRLRFGVCTGCRRQLRRAVETCWFCGGTIAGELAHAADRLDLDDDDDDRVTPT